MLMGKRFPESTSESLSELSQHTVTCSQLMSECVEIGRGGRCGNVWVGFSPLQLQLGILLFPRKVQTGNLIAPHELYGNLTEGTLFAAQVSLSTYINKDHNPWFMDSKVYHVNVEKLTILDKGDGSPWNPPSPGLPSATPSTPSKQACDPTVDSAFDGLSPSQKAHAA
ncbi:hypothetical protein DFH08DRAFT_813275 [Mycena albidolilacea]|uniref:Uncharacterized protein n=1 Tax=Mycena albidolilacea TaxID=1033008 RepID=A0AAD6ZSG1_9AGAR|nr:hypothetical protein DFH08DRAFT_813275 [Mycena albidolilacea]